ncbi:SDR family NAD(P)-dependent oxidoreductase [Mucilaginibacter psychrotolerans]|uniref:SDR family oxidoreductase n=1 Tax=Mucilaginibacter psychrotolerans TaxID=1524096 RepID=A0A4Y8SKD8_9SPHI|nr:SDR family oxidoreductase [Mucilaginibacter psychrotolerans]TFF38894.1 SDR family oxidoreductase [Mucilaginibacter psychrotolerans]
MNEYALITGAGRGIGKELALQLAERGYNLLLVARSKGDLDALAQTVATNYQVKALCLSADLSADGAALAVADWCKTLGVPVSILVNNAGYGLWGNFDELDLAAQMNMLKLNISALVELTYYTLPLLKKQSKAFVLNVSSVAAYQAVPSLALYSASKAFVLSFSRALRYEQKQGKVSVTCLCPGPTATGFAQRAGMDALQELAEKFNMSPAEVARVGLKAMFRKKAEIVPGFLNRVSAIAARHLNKSLVERITASLYKK